MRVSSVVLITALACGWPSHVYCGGFQIRDQGGAVAGAAYAGAAAIAEDASTIFYNPAGMARLGQSESVVSVDLLVPRGKFNDEGSFDIIGAPLLGSDGGYPEPALVPSGYLLWAPNIDWLRFGLAINSPYGLSTDYGRDGTPWVGRYHALLSEVVTFNFNPSVSVRLFDWLSIGGGLSAQWMDATLTNAIDFGSVCYGLVGPQFCPALGLVPQGADGHVRLSASDWGFGYNAGVLISPSAGTRVGVAYRSHMDFHLDGDSRFNVPPQATILTSGGSLFKNTGIKSDLAEPETVTLGLYQKLTPKWVALVGAEWTRWSRVQSLVVQFDNPLQPDFVLPADWQDTWFYSVGVNYLYSERITLRAGIGYDESPIPVSTRTPRLPGSDAIDLAIGAGYRAYDDLQIDVAYQLALLDQADIALKSPVSGNLNGHYDFTTHVLSLQVRKLF